MKRTILSTAMILAVGCLTTLGLGGGDPSTPADPPDAPGQVASEGGIELESPSKEHLELKRYLGDWDSEIAMVIAEGAPPVISKGSSTVRPMGPFWVVEDTQMEMFGVHFVGHGVYGYDATRRKHVHFWADSAGSWPVVSEGGMDADGRTLVLKTPGPGGSESSQRLTYTIRITWPDEDTRIVRMLTPGPDGGEVESWRMTARRRK